MNRSGNSARRAVAVGLVALFSITAIAPPSFADAYDAAMARGFGKADTASVCAVLEALSGIKRR